MNKTPVNLRGSPVNHMHEPTTLAYTDEKTTAKKMQATSRRTRKE